MDDDSLLPGELDKLKKEIADLKKKQGIEEPRRSEVDTSQLQKSINSLMNIFKEASEDMKMDTHDAVLVSQKIDKIIERLEKVEIQNEKIAKGIVAIADMVEEVRAGDLPKERVAKPLPAAAPATPSASTPPPSAQPGPGQPLPSYNVPKQEEKKKGFLNFKM